MIHQYLNNFIFIHINKTGGSSVEKALKIPFEHMTALEKIEQIGHANWERNFTFTVIRNPWDKVVSHYYYRVQTNQTGLGDKPIGFKKWVRLAYGNQDSFYYDNPKMFMPQVDWITDHKGGILVNEIIHFENLSDEFNRVAKKLGMSVNFPHLKASKRGNYRDAYDENTMRIIGRWFSRDIETFGYKFK